MNSIQSFDQILKDKHLDGFLVTNDFNIFYLCGFRGVSVTDREAILVFNPSATLITAQLYQNKAKKLKSKNLKVLIVRERNQVIEQAKKLLKGKKRIGFEEEDLRYSEFNEFKKVLSTAKLIPYDRLIEDLRIIKAEEEIEAIKKAQSISIKAFEKLKKNPKNWPV